MKKRKHVPYKKSQRKFSGNAGTHPKNVAPRPMRGGIRL